jgi:uncharacterized protein (DUF1800 family)
MSGLGSGGAMAMTTASKRDGFVALRRFGFGARPGEAAYLRGDPRGAVLAWLDPDEAILTGDLGQTAAINRDVWDMQEEEKRAREAKLTLASAPAAAAASAPAMGAPAMAGGMAAPATGNGMAAPAMGMAGGMEMGKASPGGMAPQVRVPTRHYQAEITAKLDRQITSDTPMVERLVNFWSNHFCVSAGKNDHVRATAGAYEREAIRPYVLGRFADMVKATAHHPAMLQFLDNQLSVGPTSKAGIREKKGLNENLAREIMELHTLGVDGGYTQADVTAFARVLTGWTLAYRNDKQAEPGTAKFAPDRHEPGAVTIMGKTYPDVGRDQLDLALDTFAADPATARHVASKLARHFVGDAAPQPLIDRLAKTFRDTDGDLAAVTKALVTSDEAWAGPQVKVLSPWDMLVALGRTFNIGWSFGEANRMLVLFGQPAWEVPFPSGWPDDDAAWAAPDNLLEMLDAVFALARRNAGDRDPSALADAVLGPLMGDPTRQAIRRAGSRDEALALLVMSPEFLRR